MTTLVDFVEQVENNGLSIEDKEDYVLQKVLYYIGNMIIDSNEMRRNTIEMFKKLVTVFMEKSLLNIEKYCFQKHGLELMTFFGLDKVATLQAPISPPDIYSTSNLLLLEPFNLNNFQADLTVRYKPIVSQKDNFPRWLNTSKRYWGSLRRRKVKMDVLEPNDRQKVVEKMTTYMDEYINDRLLYDDDSNYVEDDSGDCITTSCTEVSSSSKAFYDSFSLYYTPK